MFKKVLVANRGEIAVRIIRTCRDMGIWTVALFDASDRGSLHVRLADECVELSSELGYLDGQQIIEIALEAGCQAIHPGYGFLSEQADFIRACEDAGVAFIGPPSQVVAQLRDKIAVLERVRAAGFKTVVHSSISFHAGDRAVVEREAGRLGYPLVVKSCRGGRGRASRLVRSPDRLPKALRQAETEAVNLFGDGRLYMEQAVLPSHFVDVQLLGDRHGHLIHVGERDGSVQRNNQKLIAESPAPCLAPAQREAVRQMAIEIARLFDFAGIGTVEFLLDRAGEVHFTEIKPRIQVEHPVTEMVTRIDLVREQIEVSAGRPLRLKQEDVHLQGWAMSCRINAEDPWNNFLPSPGRLRRLRLPGGPNVRVDTYAYSGCEVPVRYDSMFAKVVVWGESREDCLQRMQRTLQDFAIGGVATNLPLLQRILEDGDFVRGGYTTEFIRRPLLRPGAPGGDLRDLAVAAAIAYLVRHHTYQPTVPERLLEGWHRANRQRP